MFTKVQNPTKHREKWKLRERKAFVSVKTTLKWCQRKNVEDKYIIIESNIYNNLIASIRFRLPEMVDVNEFLLFLI